MQIVINFLIYKFEVVGYLSIKWLTTWNLPYK